MNVLNNPNNHFLSYSDCIKSLLACFCVVYCMSIMGYSSIIPLSIIISLSFVRLSTFGKIVESLLVLICYFVLFDNDLINMTEYKIRPFYFLVIIGGFIILFRRFKHSVISPFYCIAFSYFVSVTVYFFVTSGSVEQLYIVKFIFFNIGLVAVLTYLPYKSNFPVLIRRYLQFGLFVGSFALIQFINNKYFTLFKQERLQHDWFNVFPSGFFSERTWLSQYMALACLVTFYAYMKQRKSLYLAIGIFFIFIDMLCVSRSGIIPLLCIVLWVLFPLTQSVSRLKMLFHLFSIVAVILISSFVFETYFSNEATILYEKFNVEHEGIRGRIQAWDLTLARMQDQNYNFYLGNGFEWNAYEDSSSIGTAIGAKSANVFLMYLHIYGVLGLFFICTFALYIIQKYYHACKSNRSPELILGFQLFFSFIGLSFFVPFHQYPLGISTLGLSLYILRNFSAKGKPC